MWTCLEAVRAHVGSAERASGSSRPLSKNSTSRNNTTIHRELPRTSDGSVCLARLASVSPSETARLPREARLASHTSEAASRARALGGDPAYDVLDAATGNTQYRNEERYPNGTVVGSYGYLDPAGRAHRYRYVADEKGYRVMKDRPNLYTAPIVNPNTIVNTDEDTVTWKRKKPHRTIAKNEIRRNNVNSYPTLYFI
ncbi:uncharacterized protein LOC134650445 [Cydia amplana]|uniref:uncharacterized protein LOC134650445 n=1 Tax=Cydia amplana TaxID=1869771 RepID=UPI002FE5C610